MIITEDKEKWVKIKYSKIKPNMYSISSHGNVYNNFTMKYLHPWKNNNGYLYVSLMCTDNTVMRVGVHNLVAMNFVQIPKCLINLKEPIVPNHNDFNRENNHYKNLQWMTYAMNNEWNRIHGHYKCCEDAPNSRVSNETVHMICKLMVDGFSNKDIRKILNMENTTYYNALLTRIRTGREWKEIVDKYQIEVKNTLRKNSNEFVESICKLLEQGYEIKDMRKILNIPDTQEDKDRFKKLVWFIRTRKCYKDISCNYKW